MINQYVGELLERLLLGLEQINITDNELPAMMECARLAAGAVKELDDRLLDYTFTDKAEEIHFFKQRKPQVDGRLLYYLRLLTILQLAPISDLQERRNYFKTHLVAIEQFYREHAELHMYYRLNFSHLDEYYFTRGGDGDWPVFDGMLLFVDGRFHSRKSNLFAHFFAYGLVTEFLNYQLEQAFWDPARSRDDQLIWTGSQAELVELIYALNEVAAFNDKTQDIKKLSEYLGRVFHIKISNIYATHEDNRMRKKNRTPFLEKLRKFLNDKYDYDDEHALG
ncbi:hypothetical protein HB364_13905 [Pseudoflavitalea sp. X16]|uniref:RteC domain-containing protein n=1 Tax=Paraflavitalea devenefica TaxID=2716334 RepID=UPI001421782E|nr:RteC domain-containing protein [Paraflavitalea devenefica]NII26183.1 hypothetical protein [Paraflavitalea devenefica]